MELFNEPLSIKSVTLKNRIGMSPMCQYSAIDGVANDWHFVHYVTRAVGGVGLIILEAAAVSPEGRITPYDLGLWNDNQIESLKHITSSVHKYGAKAGIQIAHAGRKASHDMPSNGGKQLNKTNKGWETLAPSAIPFEPSENVPKEMTIEDIRLVINQFKESTIRVIEAGFDILEIHAAHGYLIHEFLSPLSNKRTDKYGGSFKNRIRFLLEILESVQTVWPKDYPLFIRISATDWMENGWTINDSVALAKILTDKEVDLIDCSSGGNILTQKIQLRPGYQVYFSEAIKNTGIKTAAVGMITTHNQINEILKNKQADLILLGRELLRNPYFVLETEDSVWPTQYLRAK